MKPRIPAVVLMLKGSGGGVTTPRYKVGSILPGLLAFWFLVGLAAIPARANTTYNYTGNPFTSFSGGFACPPECNISGSFTVTQPLGPNLSNFAFTPAAFSFTDGSVTLTAANTNPTFVSFCASTDASGSIVGWGIILANPTPPTFGVLVTINGCGSPVVDLTQQAPACPTCVIPQALTNIPGTWSAMIPVAIDVKPGNPSAPVNYSSRGSIRVGILSSSTFNAPLRIDPTSLTFGATGNEKSLLFCDTAGEDVNHDGLADLVCHFDALKAGLRFSEGEAMMKGKTLDGIPILGMDSATLVPQPSVNTSFDFTTLNFPGAVQTRFFGVNDLGDAVGAYVDAAGTEHAFLRTMEGAFSTIDPQGAISAEARGINNAGQIVGFYIDSADIFHGFLLIHNQFSNVDFPGAVDTALLGINSNGDVVGAIDFGDVTTSIAFVLRNGKFTSFEDPTAAPTETEADASSVSSLIVGIFLDTAGTSHGYLLNNGVFSTIDFPGAVGGTFARGINAKGQIVGRYFDGPQGNQGYVVVGSTFFTIRFPNARVTAASGITADGHVVGFYRAIPGGPFQGFLATPNPIQKP